MLSFTDEIEELTTSGVVAPERGARLIAMERREVVSLSGELRLLTWLGVGAFLSALGVVVAHNLERIGPLTILLVLFGAAAALNVFLLRRHRKTGYTGVLDELLGTLSAGILSTAVGWGESQFDWLGEHGTAHLLILTAAHAWLAYAIASRLVLSLALGTLVAWFGVGISEIRGSGELAIRAWGAAAVVLAWRAVHRRRGAAAHMVPPFDHVAANVAGIGAVALASDGGLNGWIGAAAGLLFAAFLWKLGNRQRNALFVVYAVVYGLLAVLIPSMRTIAEPLFVTFISFLALLGAIVTIVVTVLRWRER